MILYALMCDDGHRFETWFRDSASCDGQIENRLVECPECRSVAIVKTIMAPAVVGGRDAVASPPAMDVALVDDRRRAMWTRLKALRDEVLAEAKDVGPRFPDQARRMHEGDLPVQQIRGQATLDEARGLLEDGIMILPLPVLPDERN